MKFLHIISGIMLFHEEHVLRRFPAIIPSSFHSFHFFFIIFLQLLLIHIAIQSFHILHKCDFTSWTRASQKACCAQFYDIKILKSKDTETRMEEDASCEDIAKRAPVIKNLRGWLWMKNGILNNGHPLVKQKKTFLFPPLKIKGNFIFAPFWAPKASPAAQHKKLRKPFEKFQNCFFIS